MYVLDRMPDRPTDQINYKLDAQFIGKENLH